MVEILRGVHTGARILILDEPTSALSPPEAKRLFELIRKLQSDGVSIIFISHFIEDVLAICDRLTILRDGKKLETRTCSETNKHYVIQAMLGHSLDSQEAGYETNVRLPPRISGDVRLHVENLTLSNLFRDISLQVHSGECLGIYGFVGAGHQELAHTIAGAYRPTTGQVLIDDQPLSPGRVDHAVRQGAVLVAADRGKTLVQETEVYKNVTLSHLRDVVGSWLTRGKELRATLPVLQQVGCRPADPLMRVSSLSGGNQQKVVLGKWLLGEVKVLVLEEPTRGMDVGAKDEVMRLVGQLKGNGAAVLLISTEPELVLQHADRIVVMSRGKITQEFADQPVDKTSLTDAC